jgi:hypothetical protein
MSEERGMRKEEPEVTVPPSSFTTLHSAFQAMQARLIALLVRHDADRFRRYIATHPDYDTDADTPALRRYRELGVLFYLRDDLFGPVTTVEQKQTIRKSLTMSSGNSGNV